MSSSRTFSGEKLRNLVGTALLLALVIVLQLIGTFVKIGPIPMSLVLIPIVLGACLYGPKTGAFLGFAFSVIVLIGTVTGADAFSLELFLSNRFWTVFMILLKGTLAGWCAGIVFASFRGKHPYAAALLASAVCPVVNTLTFCLFMLTILQDYLLEISGGTPVIEVVFLSLAGVNFVGEFLINVLLCPVLIRLFPKKTH